MATDLATVIVTGLVSGIGSSVVTSWLQHCYWKKQHAQQRQAEREFWKIQRGDEQRLDAITRYNQLMNAYIAACITQVGEPPPIDEWLRDINAAAGVIRNLCSSSAYEAAKKVSEEIKPYAEWAALQPPARIKRGHDLADLLHAALGAMYEEVVGPGPGQRR